MTSASLLPRLLPVLLSVTCLLLAGTSVNAALPVRSAILMNMSTGKILFEKAPDTPIPPASLTKVMNMFLALDAIRSRRAGMGDTVHIKADVARTGGSSMHLRRGKNVSVRQLLSGMAVASGNDAARALARQISGSERRHVRPLTAHARRLGTRRTQFRNPTGLPASGQMTCARDMLVMARAYLVRHPSALAFHSLRFFQHCGRQMRNTNNLLGVVPGVDGLKTGYTNASGYNLIFTARRKGVRLLGVVMGGSTAAARDAAARSLLEMGFRAPRGPRRVEAAPPPAAHQVRARSAGQRKVSAQKRAAPRQQKRNKRP